MEQNIQAYLADIGRKGGRRSRRTLDSETVRAMVRVREVRRAFRRFRTECFWSFDPEYRVELSDVPWVVLALAGRDEARDVVDTLEFHRTLLGLGPLCWAACGKDPGYNPLSLLELLRRRGRIRPEDLARLALVQPIELSAMKLDWLAALDSVEPFVDSRPPEETGCLYYSAAESAFVDPLGVTDAVPHFGRPGGVVPGFTA